MAEHKEQEMTRRMLDILQTALDYFEEVVLVTPNGSYFMHSIHPARCDERLYISGYVVDPEDK